MLLLLLEVVELLSGGLGVAIVVLDSSSSSSTAAQQRSLERAAVQRALKFALSLSKRDTAPAERSCTITASRPRL